MSKILDCTDITGDCDFQVTGETVAEVVQRAAAHAKNEHDMKPTSDLVERIRDAIRDS